MQDGRTPDRVALTRLSNCPAQVYSNLWMVLHNPNSHSSPTTRPYNGQRHEISNQQHAAWGTVFSACAPNISLVHRPGRKHSNLDPLSRLYRAPPPQDSPARGNTVALEMSPTHIDFSANPSLGKAVFMALSINDSSLEGVKEAIPAVPDSTIDLPTFTATSHSAVPRQTCSSTLTTAPRYALACTTRKVEDHAQQ